MVRLLDYPKIIDLWASLTPQEIKYEFIRLYILPKGCIYKQIRIYSLIHILYYIGCIYNLMRIYGLTHIRYHIFHIDIISHVLRISHVLTYLRSSYIPIFQYSNIPYDVAPYGSNSVYLSLYGLLWPCTNYMAFSLWDLSTVPGVTPTLSHCRNTPS